MALTLPAKFFSWANESVEMPNLDKIAYYMGYIIGFIIQLILEILFTGGAKTVADAFSKLAESLMAVFKTLKSVAFKLKKGAVIAFENLLGVFAYIREKSKNLKTFLDELWEIIQGWSKKGKADELLQTVEDLRKFALTKWLKKFDENFVNHLSGDVEILKVKVKLDSVWRPVESWIYVGTRGQGGHWLNKFLTVDKITFPPGISKVAQLADNIPFKAKVTIKSLKWKKFPKFEESSMFPKNWSIERIQEEIAFVYENTVAKGEGFLKKNNGIEEFEGLSSNEFKIRIQIQDGNIINSFPSIN